MKHKVAAVYSKLDDKFLQQFGFCIRETTLEKIVDYMFVPKDASCLAFTRIVFGIAMFFDTVNERGGEHFEDIWGNPNTCFFPLVPFIVPTTMPKMAVVYASLWIATLGIALGYKYRFSCEIYILCYWYLVLIDKSVWNNHTYLFGLVAILLVCTDAGRYWSLDVYIDPSKKKESVPYWNYFILKYQFFILYFMAGIKKCSREWLEGYSVAEIHKHWVFDLFRLFLTPPQINKYIVHYFISVFDLTISMWMMWSRSRNIAVLFCSLFHFMNMRIFNIGMFPWLCLGTIPLFYPFDVTKRKLRAICPFTDIIKELSRNIFSHCYSYLKIYENITYENTDDPAGSNKTEELTKENSSGSNKDVKNRTEINELEVSSSTKFVNSRSEEYQEETIDYKKNKHKHNKTPKNKKKRTVLIIFLYMVWQAFMPFSHFITKGYNTWTEGLYGYSWDMMMYDHTQAAVTVRVVDNAAHTEFFFDRNNTQNERWAEHADMVYQYAHCIKNTMRRYNEIAEMRNEPLVDDNISIYIDAWVSLNSRFHQRVFDPNADMLSVTWSPFETPSYVLPLLEEASGKRDEKRQIEQRIKSFSNDTYVLFFVSLPGHTIERFITPDLEDVAVTVLNGTALFVTDEDSLHSGQSYKLTDGEAADVPTDCFHKVTNIGHTLLYFMYTERCPGFSCNDRRDHVVETKLNLPIYEEFMGKLRGIAICAQLLIKHIASGCIKCLNGRPFETK